ncbi:MAG: hypothetical protein QXH64_05065, partial [Nitrososphaeria archaeon]
YPPLYRVLLAGFIMFMNITRLEHAVFMMKLLTVTFDWLLILTVYLLGRKLYGADCGIIASSLLLFCFPLYEINFWGGYPSMLSMIYLCLIFLYLASRNWDFPHALIIFILAFSIILTHQFTTFLAVIVLGLYSLIAFVAFKASIKKSLVVAIMGAFIAFIFWYAPVILPYLDLLIYHTFFSEKQYLYLVWRVTPDVFLLNFGFILLLALIGLAFAFLICKKIGEMAFYVLLSLGFVVPLIFTQSYLTGLMLPYDRFVYYLMPTAVVFAASVICLLVRFAFFVIRKSSKIINSCLKVIPVFILIGVLFASRFPFLPDKISEAVDYYSYMDARGYAASLWLKNNYLHESAVVTTEKPGIFFGLMSNKRVFMETNPVVERAALAETILNLAYELEHPLILYRIYEVSMPYELEQFNILIHNLWKRVLFLYSEDSLLSFTLDGKRYSRLLADLDRRIFWGDYNGRKILCIQYHVNDDFYLLQTVEMSDYSFPVKITWRSVYSSGQVSNLSILLSLHFDLHFIFNCTYAPGIFHWENPLSKASSFMIEGRNWTTFDFSPADLSDDYVVFYDSVNCVYCAIKFNEPPALGSIGVLSTGQVDALRLTYNSSKVTDGLTFSYVVLVFSEESFHEVNLDNFKDFFDAKSEFHVKFRDYLTFIIENDVKFIIFESDKFRMELLNSGLLHLIYSTDGYVICKIKNHNASSSILS